MGLLLWIMTGLLVLGMGGTGAMKLTNHPEAVEAAKRLNYMPMLKIIGVLEVLAAAGVVLGAAIGSLEWLGYAAGIGVIAPMAGAVGFHLRAKDRVETIPAAVLIGAAVLYVVALGS